MARDLKMSGWRGAGGRPAARTRAVRSWERGGEVCIRGRRGSRVRSGRGRADVWRASGDAMGPWRAASGASPWVEEEDGVGIGEMSIHRL